MSGTLAKDRRLRVESLETRQMLAFTIGTEFTAGSGPGFIPPDTMGTVGPNHIVELINGRYAVYNKAGVLQTATSLDQFWINSGVAPAGAFSFDPRVLYDVASARFFAAAVDNASNANNFLVAVSGTSDPTAGWTGFQIDSDADDSHWADFPMLGLDNHVLTVSANMFGLAAQPMTTSFLVIPKNDLLAAVPTVANATLFENVNTSNTGSSAQPIVDLDNGNLPLPILSSFNKPLGFLKTSSIGGTPLAPTLNTAGGLIGVTSRGAPPDIDQPGPKADIDAGSNRFSGNVIQQQIPGRVNPSLWGVHGVDIGGRAAIEWYEINAVTNAVLQSGTVSDPSLAFNYPSIAVNDFGDVVIGFSGGDPSTFMSTYVAVGHTTAGVTTFDPVTQTHAGVADYENLVVGINRWGDYSATVLDPTDQRRAWTFQEFASGTDQWSVRVTEINLHASVAGRHIFYNDSFFDGNDPAQGVADDAAVPSKVAYLKGDGLAVYNNITNFTKGITGIMVDLGGGGDHASITAADFSFKHGTNNTPASWATVSATPTISVRLGDGDGGADRVTVTWATNDIKNEWVEVQVLATAKTGLASADVHYWGNRAADSGEATPATFFQTTTSDSSTIFSHLTGSASVDNDYDYNRSGNVTTSDSSLVFGFLGNIIRIDLPGPAPANDGTSAVASALAVATDPSKAAKEVRGRIDFPAVSREPAIAPARRFWHQLGEASDARASIMLVAQDANDEALDLGEWLSGASGRL